MSWSDSADVALGRRVFVHINNTNPVLIEDSPERAEIADMERDVAEMGTMIEGFLDHVRAEAQETVTEPVEARAFLEDIVADAQRALGTPLTYVSGRPGNEIFLTFRDIGGSGLFQHHDRLYLQFRKGRLAGWKGDWGENWMWR